MVRVTYVGLGDASVARSAFDRLAPYVQALIELQDECEPLLADYAAFAIALDAIETAAFHFTRRRHFYHTLRHDPPAPAHSNGRLSDRHEARAALAALAPYDRALRALQRGCRPFGRDYLALQIALQGLETAAYHFTREPNFYGARADSAGPTRPPL